MRARATQSHLGRFLAVARAVAAPADRAVLEVRRDAWLRRLLAHARCHVPLAGKVMDDAGVAPGAIRSIADLGRLPVLTKADYQRAGLSQTVAGNVAVERLLDRSTSGSTGERMIVRRTWFEERLLNAFRWRALSMSGHRLRDRLAGIGFRAAVDRRDNQLPMRLAQRAGFLRTRLFDGLSDPHLAEAVAAFDPHTVAGMTSALARLADAVATGECRLRPRLVFTGGELLTPPLRARVAALGAPMRDFYGCNETNLIAWQCPNGAEAYHVCDDALIVEVLGPDGREVAEGEEGDVVVTSLFSYAMPFIRYRVGDTAVRGPSRCACGAGFSTLLAVRGRTIDCFDLGDARVLHPWEILNAIRPHMQWIRQFQMVQRDRRRIELRVVANGVPAAADIDRVVAAARSALAAEVKFDLLHVATIEPDPSGKVRPFVPRKEPL